MHSIKRTLLVTGASSGIGRAISRQLIRQGHHIIALSRDCRRFKHQPENFSFYQADLSQLDTIPDIARQIQSDFPALDGVIFSAGTGLFGSLEEFSYRQMQTVMNVNFTGQAMLTRALLPQLKRKSHTHLIYIGSEAALKGSRKGTMYCASKFALRGFTQALREESAKSKVKVTLINPGMVKTEFFNDLSFEPGSEPGQYIRPEDIAQAVDYVLNASPAIVIDEINLNPLNKVVQFKK